MQLAARVASKCRGRSRPGARYGASSPRRHASAAGMNRAEEDAANGDNAELDDAPPSLPAPGAAVEEPQAAWTSQPTATRRISSKGSVGVAVSGCFSIKHTVTQPEIDAGVVQLLSLLEPGERLHGLGEVAKAQGTSSLAQRLLRKHDGNLRRASDHFELALRWCEGRSELLKYRHFRLGGDERVMGLNFIGRPVIYLCMKNQLLPTMQYLDQKVCTMLGAIDCMPDGVEHVVQIWDMHGQAFRYSDLNFAPLIKELQTQESFFAERLGEIVIVGMPRMAVIIKDLVWPFVPERTRKKIRFLTDDASAKQYVTNSCDDKVAGRILNAMHDNRDSRLTLEERKVSWQRMDEFGQLVPLVAGVNP